MSLTPDDLSKIGNLIETKLEQKLDEKFDQKLAPIKKQIKQIDKKLDAAIQLFDGDVTHLKKRTARIEDHLGLPTP